MTDYLDEFENEPGEAPEESFHIEVDLYDTGDYVNMLVVPCTDQYIVVSGNEHLGTLAKTCDEPECWEQQEGALDDEVVEKIGAAISSYTGLS
ncbi:hypothetical protein MUY27_05545 [Mucilaginibacter sp. RS28]|uniref:Uncharacterized protein n=1 Tax=Mucilaginibacter straminoryzae TaxID=2932774 RepID=A0A9X2BAU3_9SPHI|nr:hypothetical protein [Mucilaginibacter straminoryzae]MCJ8209162.1 hypothetical protein [Mucilaginibacter straminoryzae]